MLVNDAVSERPARIDWLPEETKVPYRVSHLFPFNQKIIFIFYRLMQLSSDACRMSQNQLKLLVFALCAAVRLYKSPESLCKVLNCYLGCV